MKLFSSMLTTYGYALFAAGAWEPLAKGQPSTVWNLVAAATGMAVQALSLHISPHGEPR